MKIHGTAKGGAINKKDFGVAFGGNGVTPFSNDSDLKGYWKFNETSGDIINVSESDETVGSSGDIQITGATYNQDEGSPFDYSMLFDGVNDYGVFGSSLTDWKFLHDNSGITSTICFWAKINSIPASGEEYILSIINTDSGFGFFERLNSDSKIGYGINSGAGSNLIVYNESTANYIPNTSNWYFYVITYNQSLASDNYSIFREANNEENGDKEANTPASNNSSYALHIASRASDAPNKLGDFYIAELSIWDRVLTDDEIDELYNSGKGKPIYV